MEAHSSDSLVAAAAEHANLLCPGATWAYSNTGYVMLGLAGVAWVKACAGSGRRLDWVWRWLVSLPADFLSTPTIHGGWAPGGRRRAPTGSHRAK